MIQNTSPLLSIIIPTKNRYECLIPVINAILSHIDSSELELIVHDNSTSNDLVVDFFREHKDLRLKYFYVEKELSMVDNTAYAINKSTGKYVVFIGDDDLVSPFICDITKVLDEKDISCLIFKCGYYWWDSVVFYAPTIFKQKKTFWLPKKISMDLVLLNSKDEMEKVLKSGGVHYGNLPRFYHGIVKRTVLDEIHNKTGTYLPGHCPDMSFAASISQIIDSYSYMNYPVTIFGASKNSGAGWGENKSHFGKIEEMSFLPKGIIDKWNPKLPKIWSGQTTNAQTLFEVFKAFNVEKEISYGAFYASMLVNEPFLKNYLMPVIYKSGNVKLYIQILLGYARNYLKLSLMKYYLLFRFKIGKFKFDISSMNNVDDCMLQLKKIQVKK